MAGRIQHYIPQAVQRAFCVVNNGNKEQVWCFRAEDEPAFCSSIGNVAAERDFYSIPAVADEETLDDVITNYEVRVLDGHLKTLRGLRPGDEVPVEIATEVIAHLVFRAKFFRTLMSDGVVKLLTGITSLIEVGFSPEVFPAYPIPEGVEQLLAEKLLDKSDYRDLNIDPEAITKLAYAYCRENAENLLSDMSSVLVDTIEGLELKRKDWIRSAHGESLENIIPTKIVEQLSILHWTVVSAPSESAILPDCVGLASEDGEQFEPLLGATKGAQIVVFPISSNYLLVGYSNEILTYDSSKYNICAVACSTELFLADKCTPEFERLKLKIGKRLNAKLDNAITGFIDEAKSQYTVGSTSSREGSTKVQGAFGEIQFRFLAPPLENKPPIDYAEFANSLIGCFDSSQLNSLSSVEFVHSPEESAREILLGYVTPERLESSVRTRSDRLAAILPKKNSKSGCALLINQGVLDGLSPAVSEAPDDIIELFRMALSDIHLIEGAAVIDKVDIAKVDSIFAVSAFSSIRAYRRANVQIRDEIGMQASESELVGTLRDLWSPEVVSRLKEHTTEADMVMELLGRMSSSMEAISTHAGRLTNNGGGLRSIILRSENFLKWFSLFEADMKIINDCLNNGDDPQIVLGAARHLERLMASTGLTFYEDSSQSGDILYSFNEKLTTGEFKLPFESLLEVG